MIRFRYESFGGIVSSTRPAFLAHVGKGLGRLIGGRRSKLWERDNAILSAPTEAHVSITNQCRRRCPHCYMASGDEQGDALDTQGFRQVIDELARMRVFHIALGGGEALLRDDLFDIAEYAKSKGIVPNLTTSGDGMTAERARRCRVFGRINVSLDAVPGIAGPRGADGCALAGETIRMLQDAGIRPGINTVLTRETVPHLERLFKFAREQRLSEIECLRFKPAGRAKTVYHELKCTPELNCTIIPTLRQLAKRYRITLKIDCSMLPMLCYHEDDPRKLERYGYGCEAGNVLIGVRADGVVSPCSFAESIDLTVDELQNNWTKHPGFDIYRKWTGNAPDHCRSCKFLHVCKGGCHVVAAFETGDPQNPDPGCPFVLNATPL